MQWCLEVLPNCGSFQQTVHRAILPAILQIKQEQDSGQPQEVAIAEAVPGLLEAMAQSFSCREMCQAVVDTCSCKAFPGESLTFGEALTAAQENNDNFQQVRLHRLCAREPVCSRACLCKRPTFGEHGQLPAGVGSARDHSCCWWLSLSVHAVSHPAALQFHLGVDGDASQPSLLNPCMSFVDLTLTRPAALQFHPPYNDRI